MTGFIQKLFRLRQQDVAGQLERTQVSTPIPPGEMEAGPDEGSSSPVVPPQLMAGCAQSVGMQRDHNEDALFTLTTELASDTTSLPFGLYIVADGMGGHKNGEVASRIAVRAMAGHLVRKLYTPLLSLKPATPSESIQEMMFNAVQEAHQAILKEAPGGGTTLTSVLVLGERMTIAHVGDSRVYALNGAGTLEVLTRDHSLVKRLVELGQLSEEEAAVHPQRNVLYRALGQSEPFEPDISTSPLPESGYLLICSDGLWGVLSEENIAQQITAHPDLGIACQRMVDAANVAGGPDNITAVLVRLPG